MASGVTSHVHLSFSFFQRLSFNCSAVTKELKQLIELEGKAVGVGDHVGEKREEGGKAIIFFMYVPI